MAEVVDGDGEDSVGAVWVAVRARANGEGDRASGVARAARVGAVAAGWKWEFKSRTVWSALPSLSRWSKDELRLEACPECCLVRAGYRSCHAVAAS